MIPTIMARTPSRINEVDSDLNITIFLSLVSWHRVIQDTAVFIDTSGRDTATTGQYLPVIDR
jgi:hypothetical protein